MIKTEIRSHIPANKVKSYSMDENTTLNTLDKLGIGVDNLTLKCLMKDVKQVAMDSDIPLSTLPNLSSPVQFLQFWISNIVRVITSARKIDEIAGRTMAGTWKDEEIVQTFLELTGSAKIYGDHTNIPLASWNETFETRSIVRLELGCETGILEEERAGAMRINSASEKKTAIAEALAIAMNKIGFYGYNGGANKTYGLFNDPNLPSYITVALGASNDTEWSTKTFLEITDDIKTAIQSVVSKCGGRFDVYKDSFQLDLPLSVQQYLNTMNTLGTQSVKEWLSSNYPNCRLVFAPELDGANGGSNVMYIIVDKLVETRTLDQYIQDNFRLLGVEKRAKGMIEDYSCATSGIFFKNAIGVSRYTGI